MVAQLAVWTQHLYHQTHDWCIICALILVFASFEIVAIIRHALWRRRVLSACR
jgi:hypothetical protein